MSCGVDVSNVSTFYWADNTRPVGKRINQTSCRSINSCQTVFALESPVCSISYFS